MASDRWLGNGCALSDSDESRYGGNGDSPLSMGYVSPDQYERNRDYYDHQTI